MTLAEAIAEWERAMLSERKDWLARQRMLSRRPDYQRLDTLAHDLRNGDPLTMDFLRFKRDYQSAVTWWLAGTLRPLEFLARARAFESAARREFERMEAIEDEYWNADWKKRIRAWNRRGFVSRRLWRRLSEARRRDEEWLAQKRHRLQTARQRAFLREGERTMRQIRRVLRGQDPLPQPESTPVRSSQT